MMQFHFKISPGKRFVRASIFILLYSVIFISEVYPDDQTPDVEFKQIAKLLQVSRGSIVADVGAGSGWWTMQLAEQVGKEGHVFSTEVKPSLVKRIRAKAQSRGFENVTPILGNEEEMGLPENSCEALLLRFVYHAFDKPEQMRKSLSKAMKSGGLVLIIDFRPEPEQLKSDMMQVGFENIRFIEKWQGQEGVYSVLFQKTNKKIEM